MKASSRVLFALWFFQVVNYLDRTVISFAAPAIMKSLSLGPKPFGYILSCFVLGYCLGQIPGGLIADRWGAKTILVLAPLGWMAFTGATGLVSGFAGFVAVRLLFGLSEGLSNAPCWKVIGDTFDVKDRTRAGAIWLTALPVAPALAGPIMALLLFKFGWRHMFMLLALPALVAAFLNWIVLPRRKTAGVAGYEGERPGGLGKVFKSPTLWVLGVGYFFFSVTYWGYLAWMPTYLATSRGINLKSVGLLGSIPYVAAVVGLMAVGWLGSTVFKHSLHIVAIACFAVSAVGLYGAYTAGSLRGSLVGLSVAAAFLYGGLSCYGTLVINMAPAENRGSFSSVVTAMGQLGGVIAPALIGYMVQASGNFNGGFILMILCIGLSAGCLAILIRKFSALRISLQVTTPSVAQES